MKTVITLMLVFPLAGAVFNMLVGRRLARNAVTFVACAAVIGALVMAVIGVWAGPERSPFHLWTWIGTGDFSIRISILYDATAVVMALMVTFVSTIIHLYSVAFMRNEEDYLRYFVYLNLFVFSMLVITLADNLLFVYLGWEGVGFCSYALIGFWYTDPVNMAAGRKAFLLTRIGDVGFAVGLAVVFGSVHQLSIHQLGLHPEVFSPGLATVIGLLFLWAALGKSAQLPLSVWLPDAMAGPTPVSALIHAATMVTAGAYLLIRLFPVISLSPAVLFTTAVIGALTALYSGFAALFQTDIKRILAYSTISQVSYMFLAVGAGDIIGGLFLLISHAFFKALLFLAAGCVIQALAEEHDIFKMGNLKKYLPSLYWIFLIGSLSLSAFPLIGGFFSKDRILISLFLQPSAGYKIIWVLALVGAMITPLYSMRLFLVVFADRSDGRRTDGLHPLPKLMVWVLWPLAILALFDGCLNLPFGPGKEWLSHYLAGVPGALRAPEASSAVTLFMGVMDAVLVAAMVAWSYFLFAPPFRSPASTGLGNTMREGFFLDRIYQAVWAGPYRKMAGFLAHTIDENGLDHSVERGARAMGTLSMALGAWNDGRLSFYIKCLFVGLPVLLIILIISWFSR